jgi:geranylgeranylglycerol-phosphate geranylgeranyltransferase
MNVEAGVRGRGAELPARLLGVVKSTRFTTRLWFDLIAPAATMMALRDGPLPLLPTLEVLGVALFLHAAGNYHNDLNDEAVDKASNERSRTERALITGQVSARDLRVAGWVAVALSLGISVLLPWPAVAVVVAIMVMSVLYNFEPVRLAGRPVVLQFFWPCIWALTYLLCGVAIGTTRWWPAVPYLLFVAVFMGVGEGTTQDIRDADNDAAGGRRTTPVVWGVPASTVFALVVQVISVVPWLWFALTYPLPLAATIAGTAALSVWLGVFTTLTVRLVRSFDKPAARMTHVGSIYTFTAVNLAVLVGAAFVAV